jgi:RNA polymerase sigma factor (sigma-70 family)
MWEQGTKAEGVASGGVGVLGCRCMTKTQPDTISWEALQSLLSRRMEFLGFLEKRVGSRATAEDILQSAFVRGIERGGEIREEESVVAWFYRLLRNAVIDHYRREASSGRAMEGFARELEGAEIPSPDLRNEICQCVSRVLTELKPEYREALEVVDVGEASLTELATRTGISANNAGVRVHRARQALQKQVKLTCGACAEHGCLDCRCKSDTSVTIL